MKCLACDFGGSSVKYALIDENAAICDSGRVSAPLGSCDEFVQCVYNLYNCFAPAVAGIALSMPGIIDVETGVHLGSGAYSSLLKGKCVTELISRRCGVETSIENDGKCGALAELWNGALCGAKDGAVLILGTAIGGGVITQGNIQRGAGFFAGEFSYAITEPGRYGLLAEAWMNIGVIGMTYKICKLKNIDLSIQDAGGILMKYDAFMGDSFPTYEDAPQKIKVDGKQIFCWIDRQDKEACLVYGQFLHSMAVLIHSIQLCCAPEKIVLGGGLSRAKRLLPDVEAELKKLYAACLVPPAARATLCLSRYLDECNLVGAMYSFLRQHGGTDVVS